ncbi:MAG: hypothetical protein WCX65_05720 [bacterium]
MKFESAGRLFYMALVPIVVGGLAFAIYFFVFSPSRSGRPVEPEAKLTEPKADGKTESDPVMPNVEVEKPEISHLVNGQVAWTVSADSVKSDAETGITKLFNSHGLFVRGKDSGLDFSGPMTVYNAKEKSVRVEGDIQGRLLPEEHTLTAQSIDWNEKSGKVVAEKIVIQIGKAKLTGGRMELTPDSRRASFSGGVKIEMPVERKTLRRGI